MEPECGHHDPQHGLPPDLEPALPATSRATGSSPAPARINRSDYIEIFHDQEQIGNRFDATFRGNLFGLRNEFVVGFDVNHIDFLHTNNSPYGGASSVDPFAFDPGQFLRVNGTSPGYRTTTDQYAVFAEDRLILSDQLSLIAGVRYEAPTLRREDLRTPSASFTKDLSAVSYRFGAVYTPTTGHGPLRSVRHGRRSGRQPDHPVADARRTSSSRRASRSRWATSRRFWDGRGEFTLAGYRIKKDNLLTVDPNRPTIAVQVGSQSAQGVEAFLSLGLWENWRAEANLALLHAQYDDFQQAVGGVAGQLCRQPASECAGAGCKPLADLGLSRRAGRHEPGCRWSARPSATSPTRPSVRATPS